MGRSGYGLPVYGIAVYDSMAWLRISRPLEAATCGGMLRVLSGSNRPKVGFKRRLAMPVLACMRLRSKILTPVVSLPVPAVVGIANSGFNGPGTGQPFADGRIHVVQKIGRRICDVQVDGLRGVDGGSAANRDDMHRKAGCLANAMASRNDSSVGSTRTRS